MKVQLDDIIDIILFVLPDHKLPISGSTRLIDVISDSIEYVEMAMEIQGRFDIPVDSLPHYEQATVNDFVEYINSTPQLVNTSPTALTSKGVIPVPMRSRREKDDVTIP